MTDCVVVSCFRYQIASLHHFLAFSEIRVHRAETLSEADFLLTVTDSTVLISDAVFLDGTWEDALEMLQRLHPRVSLLVAADPADLGFAAGAVNRGACAILRKPLDFLESMRVIRTLNEAVLERRHWQEEEAQCRA